jgi:phosphate transport system substrate-binding protein
MHMTSAPRTLRQTMHAIASRPARLIGALAAGLALAASLPALAAGLASAQDVKSIRGAVRSDGSSTVYPLTEAVAEEFRTAAPNVRVTVGLSGTGGGFKRFAAGEIDVANASRSIKKSEADAAKKNGIEFIELPIAFDGLSIVVNPKNTWVKSLTVDQLKKIFSATDSAKTWKDVDPSWPANTIKIYSPGTDSGTFDYFREVVVGKDGKIRGDITASEDDNTLVSGVTGDENAIGFFGCAYYFENKSKLRSVPIDGGKGPISPTHETIENGTYAPFSRPLFIYVNKTSAAKPEVRAFVDFYIQNAGKLADDVGYVTLPKSVYDLAAKNFAAGRTGTQFITETGDHVPGKVTDIYK